MSTIPTCFGECSDRRKQEPYLELERRAHAIRSSEMQPRRPRPLAGLRNVCRLEEILAAGNQLTRRASQWEGRAKSCERPILHAKRRRSGG